MKEPVAGPEDGGKEVYEIHIGMMPSIVRLTERIKSAIRILSNGKQMS